MILVILMWWKRAAKRRWLICLAGLLILFYLGSTIAVTRYLVGSLEWNYPRQESSPDHAGVIVVLGSDCRYYDDGSKPPLELDDAGMNRALHAARIYHKVGGCLIIVSGHYVKGEYQQAVSTENDPTAANPMGQFLKELGVNPDDIILEEESRTTYENACRSKEIIEKKGLKDIVVVTDAIHMGRSVLCFEELGLKITPAACYYHAEAVEFSARTLLPSDEGTRQARQAVREYIGLVWYWLHGRI